MCKLQELLKLNIEYNGDISKMKRNDQKNKAIIDNNHENKYSRDFEQTSRMFEQSLVPQMPYNMLLTSQT